MEENQKHDKIDNNNNNDIKSTNIDYLKNITFKTDFSLPDLNKLKADRNERNENFLSKYELHHDTCGNYKNARLNTAAITIQRVVRGFFGRKRYLDVLYEAVLIGEDELHQQQERQQLEGEILIESYRIEREIEENDDVTRNRTRFHHANATKIQRVWRKKYGSNPNKEHVCCSCVDDFPELYDYYKGNNSICFCCEEHRLLSNAQRLELLVQGDSESQETSFETNIDTELQFMDAKNMGLPSSCGDLNKTKNDTPLEKEILLYGSAVVPESDKNYSTVGASKSVLKSLEILQEHENESKQGKNSEETVAFDLKSNSVVSVTVMTFSELRLRIKHLESAIVGKNLELLKELMVRDDLFTKNEALRMDADKLAANEIKARK